MRSKWFWAALALVAVLGITTAASATTRSLITGKMIASHTINSKHLVDHTIQAHDLSNALVTSLHGVQGARGAKGPRGLPGISKLETDGPYPGADIPPLNSDASGYQSTTSWAGDGSLQSSWVVCAKGKVALGGGFGQNDVQSDQLLVVTSAPVEFTRDASGTWDYHTIDSHGSFVPNGWLVQGYNKSGSSLVVRPWIICAKVHT